MKGEITMKNFTAEMIEKAKAAKNAEELLIIAKENNVEMTAYEAKTLFEQMNPKSGELDEKNAGCRKFYCKKSFKNRH